MFEGHFNSKRFEEAGLKIDQERVLTYSKLSCPFDCRYCFAEDMNYNQNRDVAYLSSEQKELLGNLPEQIKLIMLGCDTEFFQSKQNAHEILNGLLVFKKDISVVTKSFLSPDYIRQLKGVDEKLRQNNNSLFFSMSLPCFDSAEEWEPKAPAPEKRVETLASVHEAGVRTLVAIRPLLPTISEEELNRIIDSTKRHASCYYSGPLYLKDLNSPLLTQEQVSNLNVERMQPHWMPDKNVFYRIEKEGQMELLKKLIEDKGKLLFEGAADAIKHINEYEKY